MTETDIFDRTVQWVPRNFDLSRVIKHYAEIMQNMDYWRSTLNSLVFSLVISLCQLLSCTMIGYGFGRYNFRGKGFLFALVIFTLGAASDDSHSSVSQLPILRLLRAVGGRRLQPDRDLLALPSDRADWHRCEKWLYIFIARQHFRGMPRVGGVCVY